MDRTLIRGAAGYAGVRMGRALTLIELLVVVVFLALSISILLPALAQSQRHSRTVVCLNQCRALGAGMTFYQMEHGNFPAHEWRLANNRRWRWFDAITEYAGTGQPADSLGTEHPKQQSTLRCPCTPDWAVGRNNSYGYNYKYLGSVRDNHDSSNRYRPYETFPVREVYSPSRTIAFGDSDGTGWTQPWGPEKSAAQPEADPDPERIGNHGYLLDPTYIPLRSLSTTSDGAPGAYAWRHWRSYLSERHMGKSCVLLADGHGEVHAPRLLYRDNSFWNGLGIEPDNACLDWNVARDPHVASKWDASSGQSWRYAKNKGLGCRG